MESKKINLDWMETGVYPLDDLEVEDKIKYVYGGNAWWFRTFVPGRINWEDFEEFFVEEP